LVIVVVVAYLYGKCKAETE